jgi:hypothetical protein
VALFGCTAKQYLKILEVNMKVILHGMCVMTTNTRDHNLTVLWVRVLYLILWRVLARCCLDYQ